MRRARQPLPTKTTKPRSEMSMENQRARLRNHRKHSHMRNSPVTPGKPESQSQPDQESRHLLGTYQVYPSPTTPHATSYRGHHQCYFDRAWAPSPVDDHPDLLSRTHRPPVEVQRAVPLLVDLVRPQHQHHLVVVVEDGLHGPQVEVQVRGIQDPT